MGLWDWLTKRALRLPAAKNSVSDLLGDDYKSAPGTAFGPMGDPMADPLAGLFRRRTPPDGELSRALREARHQVHALTRAGDGNGNGHK